MMVAYQEISLSLHQSPTIHRCIFPQTKVDHSILETAFWKEEDHREAITHTLIPTDILNKSALPYSYWANDRKYSQIWCSTRTHQEIQDPLPFRLATKHAIVQEQICAVRLAENPRV